MPIELRHDSTVRELTSRTTQFVREHVLPVEDEFGGDIARAGGDEVRRDLQAMARQAGLLSPHAPTAFGGLGLGMCDRAPVFEEAGYSLFGPTALNIAAPDEGNVHLLAQVATPEQQERYLRPLVAGDVRSAFAMTEPSPGAGADPSALATTATPDGPGWRVDGFKRFITGADGAGFFIVMARTSGRPGDRGGATMFLAPADRAGITVERHVGTLDRSMVGGHCEVRFDGLRVGPADVLGEVDEGFAYAQVRLGPARMTHVMRWLGAARRAHDTALAYVAQRQGFGSAVGDLGMAQKMIADNEIDIAASRALLLRACYELDRGEPAGNETSIAKAFASEAIGRIVDNAVQLCGGLGVSDDLPIARIYREVRPFRIYDGPTEVHRWAIAKRAIRQYRPGRGGS